MALDKRDLQELGELFNKGFEKLVKPYLRTSASAGSSRARTAESEPDRRSKRALKDLGKAQEELRKATDQLSGFTKKQIASTKRGKDAQERYNRAMDAVSDSMSETADRYEEFANKSLDKQYRAFRDLAQNTQGLSSKLAASQSSSSQFASALLKTHERIETDSAEYRQYLKDIGKSISVLDKEYLKQAKLIDDTTGAIKDNLNPDDIAKLRSQLGQTQTIISENLSKIGVENIAKLAESSDDLERRLNAAASEGLKSGEQFRNSLVVIAEQLEKQGHKLGVNLADRDKIDYKELAKSIGKVNDSTNNAVAGLNKAAFKANTVLGKQFFGLSSIIGKISKNLLDSATIISNFSKAAEKTKDLYREIVDFNVAQIPASFMHVQKQSVKLGMSFKDAVKYLDENKRALGLYGQDAFAKMTGQFRDTFTKFGYNMEQASEIVAPAFESAIASGVNIRDSNAMNEYMNKTMESFKNISGIVSITAKEYARLNAELLSSQDSQAFILGMDKERGAAYADQLIALRDNYVQLGLSTQAAQELVKQQQAQKREKVTTRVREAAKGMVLAQQAGMSPEEAQEYFKLAIKGRSATPEETKRLQQLSTRIAESSEQAQQQAYDTSLGAGMAMQTVAEKLAPEGALGSMMQTGAELAMKERAKAAASPEEARRAGELAKGNESVAKFSQVVNVVNSFLENKFISAITASALALTGLAAQALLTAGALRGLPGMLSKIPGLPGAGGPAGGVASTGGTVAGKGGGVLGRIATAGRAALGIAKPVAAVAAAGAAGYAAGKYVVNPVLDYASEKITGTRGETFGGAIYTGVDKFMGLFGKSDADKMKAEEQRQKIELGKKRLAEGKPVSQDMADTLKASGINVPENMIVTRARPGATASPVVTPSGTPATSSDVNKPARTEGTAAGSGILNVNDAGSNEKLATLIEKMSEAVMLLKTISDRNSATPVAQLPSEVSTTFASRQIPTAMQALTGRA